MHRSYFPPGRLWRAVLALLFAAALVAGCGGSRQASGNDIVVGASGPTEAVSPGSTVVFTMTVENAGSNTATDVRLVDTLGAFLVLSDIGCTASGGAVCPSPLGTSMTVPSLPVGGRLVFSVSAIVNAINAGTVSNTLTATAVDDTGRLNNSATATASVAGGSNSLGVAQDGAATVAAGSTATFRVQVTNPTGSTVAANVTLNWGVTAPFAPGEVTVACSASGGATCPTLPTAATSMSIAAGTLGTGRSLLFTFTVAVPADARGNLLSSASVSGDGDTDTSNNTSGFTTQAVDARNGTYEVYAADGRAYQLTVDFDAGSYTMAGNGATDTRSFTSDGAGSYVVGGHQRLRPAQDLIVGAHSFATGVLPYVATRRFLTSVASLGATYNLMLRNSPADGSAATTRAGTARVSGNTLQVCLDDFEVVQAQTCSVGSLKNYLLSISGDVFSAADTGTGATAFTFRVARTGAADVLLAAGSGWAGDGSRQFSIGLAESAGLVDSTVYGPAVNADASDDWLKIIVDRSDYSAEGDTIADVSGLFRLDVTDALSPVAMLAGAPLPTLQSAPIWVMQSYPLVVVVGATKSGPEEANASGLLQIGVP